LGIFGNGAKSTTAGYSKPVFEKMERMSINAVTMLPTY
jgi:hypothetical protein